MAGTQTSTNGTGTGTGTQVWSLNWKERRDLATGALQGYMASAIGCTIVVEHTAAWGYDWYAKNRDGDTINWSAGYFNFDQARRGAELWASVSHLTPVTEAQLGQAHRIEQRYVERVREAEKRVTLANVEHHAAVMHYWELRARIEDDLPLTNEVKKDLAQRFTRRCNAATALDEAIMWLKRIQATDYLEMIQRWGGCEG